MPVLEQLIEENPILKAARVNSTPVPSAQEQAVAAVPAVAQGRTTIDSTTSTTSVTKKIAADNKEGITADSVINDISEGLKQGDELAIKLKANIAAGAAQQTKAQKAKMDSAVAKNTIDRQTATANIEADKNVNAAFEAAGGTERYIALAKKEKVASEDLIAKQKIVSDLVNDDSIGGFFNRLLFLNDASEEESVARATLSQLGGIQTNLADFATNSERVFDAVRTLDTAATLRAAGDKNLADATVKAAQYGAEADKLNADAVRVDMSSNQAHSEGQIQKWNLLAAQENMKISESNRKLLADKAAKDRRVMETWIDGVIAGDIRSGEDLHDSTDPEKIQADRNIIEARLTAGGELQEAAMVQFEFGVGLRKPTAYQTFNRLTLTAEESMINGTDPMAAIYQDAFDELHLESLGGVNGTGGKFKLDKVTASAGVNKKVEEIYAGFEASIVEGDDKNPNKAIPLSQLVNLPDLKDRKPVKNILTPLLTGDTKDLTPTHVFQLVTAGIKTKSNPEGTYSFIEALNTLKAIYTKAAVHNNDAQHRVDRNAPIQDTYKAKFEVGKELSDENLKGAERLALSVIMNKTGTIDMMDEPSLTQAMLRYLNIAGGGAAPFRELANKATGNTSVFFPGESIIGRPAATKDLLKEINSRTGTK